MVPRAPVPLCQLEQLGEGASPLTLAERIAHKMQRRALRTRIRLAKALRRPGWALRRAGQALRRPGGTPSTPAPRSSPPPLHLKPGERVCVKSQEEIQATLDENGRFEGMAYLPAVMDSFCGRSFTVRKEVSRFFDERRWRMMKLSRAVILDGAFCEPPEHLGCEYAGCQRTCFLFWKEGWLERVEDGRQGASE